VPLDALEYVVRPYTAPDAHGRIIIPSTPAGSRQRATLVWSASATPSPAVNAVNFNVVCCKDALEEQTRESDEVTIPIQDGASEIVVSRPNSMKLSKKESNTCGDNWDQISNVAQEVNADLAGWQSLMNQVTGTSDKNCGQTWKFHNQ
jgi:hypothetical protein